MTNASLYETTGNQVETDVRLPNHNVETEQAILSVALKDTSVVSLCNPEDFWVANHRTIWETILELDKSGEHIDPIIVSNRIIENKKTNLLDYIIELIKNEPPIEHADAYARDIRRLSINRKLENFAKEANKLSFAQGDPDLKISMAASLLDKVSEELVTKNDPVHISDSAMNAAQELDDISKSDKTHVGISTGLIDLDQLVNGLMPGEMITLAGRPSMGKTSLAMNIAEYVGETFNEKESGEVVLVFSLEMSAKELSKRVVASRGNLDSKLMRNADFSEDQWVVVSDTINELRGVNIYIDDRAGVDIEYIRTVIRKTAKKHKIGLIIIDYLQLIKGPKGMSTYDSTTLTSQSIKKICKDFDVPTIALSQLSRDVEKRADKRPMPSDLRESGAIEQDSDMIWFVYRDEVYYKDTPSPGIAEIIVAKNRAGETGTALARFVGKSTRFENLDPEHSLTISIN